MNKRLRRVSLPMAGFLAGIVLAPAAALAATASFSSSTSTPAVTATNTTAAGPAVKAVAKGSGSSAAVFAQNFATKDGANAFYSKNYVNTGEHYGIWGVDASPYGAGVRGQSTNSDGAGVVGQGGANGLGVYGSGGYGVVSDGELAATYHLLDYSAVAPDSGDIAGTVSIIVANNATTGTATFSDPFPAGITPIVVLTPTNATAAGTPYYVTATSTGFTVTTTSAVGADATYNYVVVGYADPNSALTAHSKTARVTKTRR